VPGHQLLPPAERSHSAAAWLCELASIKPFWLPRFALLLLSLGHHR
jgi:hypothetical protein